MLFNKTLAAKAVLSFVLLTLFLTSFQNCSATKFKQDESANSSSSTDWCDAYPEAPECKSSLPAMCRFNGQTYNEGQTVTGFLTSSGHCQSEQRICRGGSFSGSFQFASCSPSGPNACLFNGQTISSGQTITAFQNTSVPFSGSCASESRSCTDGNLTGSFNYASCSVGTAGACLFDGQTIPHGESVISFANSSVAYGQTCQPIRRTCYNGSLTAGGNHSSCVAGSAASCMFNGQTVPHNGSVVAYLNLSVPFSMTCTSQTRRCNNGVLSGSYNFAACSSTGASSCYFNGQVIASGQNVRAYQNLTVAYPGQCTSEERTCTAGNLSGSYNFGSCVAQPAGNCSLDGTAVAHGQSITAFHSSSVAFGQTCSSQERLCSNGTLSGSFGYTTCSPQGAASCLLGDRTIAHGSSVRTFQTSNVPFGQTCAAQDRLCTNGTLSGSYVNTSCSIGTAGNCSFAGSSVSHGSSVTAYLTSNVPFGQTCSSQQRNCANGVLSGNYSNRSCTVASASPCTFNGQTVAHGQSVNAYQNSTVAFGQTCASQQRTCSNGSLSGNYGYANCNVGAAASCTFNGQTVAHGQNVTAYQASTVAFGQACVSQSRSCSNGVLGGSYTFASCSVGAAASCTFNGQTIAHGQTVAAFQASTVSYGQQCKSQNRRCTDGDLGGTYTYESCSVGGAASCMIGGQTVAHGVSITAYSAKSVAYGQTCDAQSRTCSNGTLSGSASHAYLTCSVGGAASCTFNGQTVNSGASVVAYQSALVAFGKQCQSQSRACVNGNLSGSYTFGSCAIGQPPAGTCNISTNKTTFRTNEELIVNTSATNASSVQTSCDGGGWMALNINAPNSFPAKTFAAGTKNCLFRGINSHTNEPFNCSPSSIVLTITAPPPPPVRTSYNGQHCDIGGKWGWRGNELQCPAGTNPINPSLAGGCPAGFSQYGATGCYISNRSAARPMKGCSKADPSDECCIFVCSESAPRPTYKCHRNQQNDGGPEGGSWSYTNSCTCTDNFQRTYQTNYRVTQPHQQTCTLQGDSGESCYVTQQEQGRCEEP